MRFIFKLTSSFFLWLLMNVYLFDWSYSKPWLYVMARRWASMLRRWWLEIWLKWKVETESLLTCVLSPLMAARWILAKLISSVQTMVFLLNIPLLPYCLRSWLQGGSKIQEYSVCVPSIQYTQHCLFCFAQCQCFPLSGGQLLPHRRIWASDSYPWLL